MKKLNILFASPEVVPFAKTGGLADISGVLPRKLAEAGNSVKVIMPKYGTIPEKLLDSAVYLPQKDFSSRRSYAGGDGRQGVGFSGGNTSVLPMPATASDMKLKVLCLRDKSLPLEYLFVENDYYFKRAELYCDPKTGEDYADNADRFIYFCLSAMKSLKAMEWAPDIIHANDWQSALLPAFLKTEFKDDSFFEKVRSVFTIHNMAYQGVFHADAFKKLKLPDYFFDPMGAFEFWGKVNFMKAAICYADVVNTVSERYCEEIQSSSDYGCGLEGVLRDRTEDLFGILNGVDYNDWSPSKDKLIPFRYSLSNMSGKKKNKLKLISDMGVPRREQVPLIGMVTRLSDQKGLDIFEEIAEEFFDLNLQLVVLGTGDEKYHRLLTDLEKKYPDKMRVYLKFDNARAHLIEAGADAFLMPSRYEPCGLNQMYSLRYGTIPIVRATGGLADTVVDVDPKGGTGCGFEEYSGEALLGAVKSAVELFGKKRRWRAVMKEGMRQDFSWERSAQKYMELYQKAAAKSR